jgi:hypothetical protein
VTLALAYPSDMLTEDTQQFLVDAEIARKGRRGGVEPILDSILRLEAVSSVDLPQLLFDGAFDMAVTSSDRLREANLTELAVRQARGKSVRTVEVDRIYLRADEHLPALVWGFSLGGGYESAGRLTVSAEGTLFERARLGSDFTPNRNPDGYLICITSHPEIARDELARLQIEAEIRQYPDPWRVIENSPPSFCCLAVWDPLRPPSVNVHAALREPAESVSPLLACNGIATRSSTKGPAVAALRNRFRRAAEQATTTIIRMRMDVRSLGRLEESPDIRHLSVREPLGGDLSEVTAWVERRSAPRFMDFASEAGATSVIQLNTLTLELGRSAPSTI